MARKNKKTPDDQPGLLDADGVGTDDLLHVNYAAPNQVLHEKSSRRRKIFAVTFIVVACGVTLNGIAQIANPPVAESGGVTASSTDVNSSRGKSLAHDKINRWLAQTPSPLPGGYIVSWDGFTDIAAGVSENKAESPANAAELHTFTLAARVGNDSTAFYEATVLVSVDDTLGAITAAEPSLLPRVPSTTQGWSSQTWAGYETGASSQTFVPTAEAWAKAFTGSAAELRLYVGDEDPSHSYMPLQGARVLGTQVLKTGYIKPEDNTNKAEPETLIARVEVTLAWSAAADAKGSKVTYDVLVTRANTASPRIVAWGPSGTGPTLEAYGNAIRGAQISSGPDKSAPTAAPEPAADTTQGSAPVLDNIDQAPAQEGTQG
jgi:hypothetical protein